MRWRLEAFNLSIDHAMYVVGQGKRAWNDGLEDALNEMRRLLRHHAIRAWRRSVDQQAGGGGTQAGSPRSFRSTRPRSGHFRYGRRLWSLAAVR